MRTNPADRIKQLLETEKKYNELVKALEPSEQSWPDTTTPATILKPIQPRKQKRYGRTPKAQIIRIHTDLVRRMDNGEYISTNKIRRLYPKISCVAMYKRLKNDFRIDETHKGKTKLLFKRVSTR